MTKLRETIDNAMLLRGFSVRTRESYIRGVRGIAAYYHRSPDQLSDAQVRDYLVYLLRERKLSYSTCNLALNGIRFLFREVLKRPPEEIYLPGPRQPQRLPEILSREEIGRIFAAALDLRHKTLLMTTYAAGLRVSAVCHLRAKRKAKIQKRCGIHGLRHGFATHFLFPVHALSRVFRGKFLDALTQAFTQGEVRLPDGKTAPNAVESFIDGCKQQDWVVYAKSSFKNPEAVLDYLSRYTRKTAIGNERLVDEQDGQVRFRYRDYAHGNTTKVLGLEPEEFIRRFLLHIPPKRVVRIRGYGLLANRDRKKHLAQARAALGQFDEPPPTAQLESIEAFMLRVAGIDIHLCPRCRQGRLREVAILPPTRGPPKFEAPSTGSMR